MSTRQPRWAALVLALLAVLPARLAAAPAAPPSQEQVARWVRQLGDSSFRTRERASDQLWKAGRAAEPALRAALKDSDPEVILRARAILNKFKYGVYPDTPEPVVSLIWQYRGGDAEKKTGALRELFKHGRHGYEAVRRLVATEEDGNTRQAMSRLVAQEGSRLAGQLLAEGDADKAEELLETSLTNAVPATVRNYAAYWLLRGKADAKVRALRPKAEGGDKQAAEVLVYLCRAGGDLKGARRAAERLGKPEVLQAILEEQGDYRALAELPEKGAVRTRSRRAAGPAALLATYQRLAGNAEGLADELRGAGREGGWPAATAYLFNDRSDEAIAAFEKAKEFGVAFELLEAQMRLREALELAEKAKPDDPRTQLWLQARRAGLLHRLGEKEQAARLLAKLADEAKEVSDPSWYGEVVRITYRLGLKDEAFRHAALILSKAPEAAVPRGVADGLFPKHGTAVELWWLFLRKRSPGEKHAATLERLRDWFERHRAGKDFAALARDAEQGARDLPPEQREQWLQVIAETAEAAGQDDLALPYLEKAARGATGPAALTRLGDFLAGKKRWAEAARRYREAWEKDRSRPAPLYLHGWALARAGREAEGEKLMERAHWLPLADEAARYELADLLTRLGHRRAALRERQLLVRTGELQSVYVSNALGGVINDAVERKDFLQAAHGCQRMLFLLMHTGAAFLESRAYLLVPYRVHAFRARGLAAAGRLDEALKEVAACQALLPADVELPIQLVPVLEKGGKKKEAEALFDRAFAHGLKCCKEYPKSAWCHNHVAWLAACCRRRLDAAREHARKAIELAPDTTAYLDTLAEVHFRRGDKDKAVETMKQCLKREPKNEFYRKQLRRYEAGDPGAELPPHPGSD